VLALLEEMGERYGAAATAEAAEAAVKGLVLVVGRGKNNDFGVSVLGPYLLKALATPAFFHPPLRARVFSGANPGRVLVPRDEVRRYVRAQQSGGKKKAAK